MRVDELEKDRREGAPLQELAAERLASHRRRRYGFEMPEAVAAAAPADELAHERLGLPVGAARVREAVAERYKHSVSYREFLAAEAERAVAQAHAQVEIATRNVAAVAAAQTRLMEELELWPAESGVAASDEQQVPLTSSGQARRSAQDDNFFFVQASNAPQLPNMMGAATTAGWPASPLAAGRSVLYSETVLPEDAVMSAAPLPGLRVRLHEPVPGTVAVLPRPRAVVASEESALEIESLDEEIAFRAAPEFDEHLLEPLTIQPNILEFPRQLVAPRRVRPRLAEGPMRDDETAQLRIFEVEAAAVSVQPEVAAVAAAEWQSLVLDVPVRERATLPVGRALSAKPELKHMAPVMLRLIALVVDASWVGLMFVGVVCGIAKAMGPTLPRLSVEQMAIGAVAGLLMLALLYGLLFLSLFASTPGMMYAEIGLYKYDATDARRGTLRVWMLLTLLSALPAGLGLLWPIVDPDGLGWQDRVCKVYPRLV